MSRSSEEYKAKKAALAMAKSMQAAAVGTPGVGGVGGAHTGMVAMGNNMMNSMMYQQQYYTQQAIHPQMAAGYGHAGHAAHAVYGTGIQSMAGGAQAMYPGMQGMQAMHPGMQAVHPGMHALHPGMHAMHPGIQGYGDEDQIVEEGGAHGKRIPMSCDSHYNVQPILAQKILACDYFKSLYEYKMWHEVVDEIYNEVKHLEPYSLGGRIPSTAFCLLYKFFTMKLTYKQVQGLLDHKDSVYIRGIGFLYLRYVLDPKGLWEWFAPYLDDPQDFSPGVNPAEKTTVGEYATNLLTDHRYYATVLKRIPVTIQRDIKKRLLVKNLLKQKGLENEKYRDFLTEGTELMAMYSEDNKYYSAVIQQCQDDGNFWVRFTEYGNEESVPIGGLQIPPSVAERVDGPIAAGRSSSRGRGERRSGSRKRSRSRSRDRGRRRRSRSRSRGRDRDRDRRKRSRRSNSRSRGHERADDAAGGGISLDNLEQQVIQQERAAAASSGSGYARRPTSYKQALSITVGRTSQTRKRSRSPNMSRKTVVVERKRRVSPERVRSRSRSPAPKKQMSEEHLAKMAALKAKYGDASAKDKKPPKRAAGGGSAIQPKLLDTVDVVRLGQ